MKADISAGDMSAAAVGARIKDARLRRELTLAEVGRAVGVTGACICQWESGRSAPRQKWLTKLAETLGTDVPYLIAGVGGPFVEAADVIERAREEIAQALGIAVSQVKVDIDEAGEGR